MEIETTKMSTRGQVIIPKDIREVVNANEGTLFTVTALDTNTIIMKKMDKNKLVEEFKRIRASISKRLTEKEILEEVRDARKKH